MQVALIIPTLNGGDTLRQCLVSIASQIHQPAQKLVIDSASTDNSAQIASENGFAVVPIIRESFNHGGTRQLGVELLSKADVVVFMTQDAILADPQSLANLLAAFQDDSVGAAYGRQLPHKDATPIGAHARLFNYPAQSSVKSIVDASKLGIKTAFLSNSFAAYRRSSLMAIGGFPSNTILGEDMFVGAKMIHAGWKIAYCADATVYHSHDYNIMEELCRYFDIGVFQAHEAWIRQMFGAAEGEGLRYVKSEFNYLRNHKLWHLIPSAIVRSAVKLCGYRLGLNAELLPRSMQIRMSMHKGYWSGKNDADS